MTTKELILGELEKGSVATKHLLQIVQKRKMITKQAFYASLRNLLEQEKITIHGHTVSISSIWLTHEEKRLSSIRMRYGDTFNQGEFLLQANQAQYTFTTLSSLDAFLSHIFILLLDATTGPIFTYNEHEWYSYGRQSTNNILIEKTNTGNRPVLVTVVHTTPLDRALAQTFNKPPFQYYMAKAPLFNEKMSFCVLGEYLIKIQIDPKTRARINHWFSTVSVFTKDAEEEMKSIVEQKGTHRVYIIRNTRKVFVVKKRLEKYFVLKKS